MIKLLFIKRTVSHDSPHLLIGVIWPVVIGCLLRRLTGSCETQAGRFLKGKATLEGVLGGSVFWPLRLPVQPW